MSTVQIPKESSEVLLQKYEQERNKRLRKEGVGQYIDVRSEDLRALNKDPWVDYNDPRVKSPPLKDGDHVKFLITGAGINGVVFAGRLIESGMSNKDIVCVDIAGGFGGTWYYNRYPGAMCDVEGYCYVPFLEETGYQPRHKYSYGHEIRAQIERSTDHFGIQGQFCTKVNSKIWDDDRKLWIINMTRTVGDPSTSETLTVTSEFIVLAGGALAMPKIPKLPGWKEFYETKTAFHSARWDYEYTGGTQEKPDLVKLRGKRVAIIGTGATAVQIVPELAKWADHVYVVQRTPSYIGARGQTETDSKYWANITKEKGWQHNRRVTFDAYVSNSTNPGPDIIDDGWTHTPAGSGFLGSNSKIVAPNQVEEHIRELYEIDLPRNELLRKRVDEIVNDKATAEKLKAWYGSWCKRPSFHDEYLPAFNKPNVTLIDTDGKGLDGFTKNGILFDGVEHEIDALILATGFTMGMALDPAEKHGAIIKGRNGLNMSDYWKTSDSGTLLGLSLPNFPNLFGIFGRGSGLTWNITSSMETHAALIVGVLKQAQNRVGSGKRAVIDASKEGESQYGAEVAKRAIWYSAIPVCTPGFFNGEAATAFQAPKTEEEMINERRKANWGTGPIDYQEMLKAYLAKGDLKGYDIEAVA